MGRMVIRQLVLGCAIVLLCGGSSAQKASVLVTRTGKLQALSETLKQRDAADRAQAALIANSLGIPLRQTLPDGRLLELQRFLPGRGPLFYLTYNIDAADTVSTDEVWPGGSAGLALEGDGMTVGEWDGGAVFADHPDLYPRVNQVDGATALSNHATHVAGTLVGAGVALLPEARGMAPKAYLDAYDWNSDTAEMAAAAAGGLLVSNHSYGIAAGWVHVGLDTWWWIGGAGDEDPNFGYYDTETRYWDQIAVDAPYYLMVKAAGNDRWDIGPEPGQPYTIVDQDGNVLSTSTASRPPDCAPAGYDCLPTVSVAKNILTIGAVDDVIGGYNPLAGPAQVQMTGFSGWGPTDDGRIKPDVVGNGWLLMSTYAVDPYYAAAVGTSMASPNVAGSLLLLQQHYQDLHGSDQFLRAATLKALAIHTADETGPADGPDYQFGWGLLNTRAAAQVISQAGGGDHEIVEGTLANGATDSVVINVGEPDATVTATLVWADPPGTPPAPVLDPPDSMLVNDLDLRITDGVTTVMPWVLDPAAPDAPATTGDNVRDNVEQVVVRNVGVGAYTVQVSHKGVLNEGAAQPYSLIISVSPPPPVSVGYILDEGFNSGLPAGWTVVTTKGKSWAVRTPVPGDDRYDNLTGGSGGFAMVDNQFSDTSTSLHTPLLNLSSISAAVLSFNSFFSYDQFESINVDVSTDGGVSWTNAWQQVGLSNVPEHKTLDLSGSVAGHANVMLRFRFESGPLGPDGDFWQVDDIRLEVFGSASGSEPPPEINPPGQADYPNPANGDGGIAVDAVLSWSAGPLAASHNVYLGTSGVLGVADFQGNQTSNSFDPGGLTYDTTYYWRIDEVNADGTTQGVTWSFITEPVPAVVIQPGVADGGAYGNGFGSDLHETELSVNFESTGTDLVLSVTGYDIDWPDEISVYLNGEPLGYLSVGPNNGLNDGDQFAIPASLQRPGNNEILFVENTPGWVWGVTNLLLTEGVITGDAVLTPGVPDTGEYGYGYGTNANDTQFLATFESTGTDLVLSVTGYDIDNPDEISVYLNGEPLGYLSVGPNNGLNDGDQFAIPASLQRPGNNEILFVENTPGWVWGITDLYLYEGSIPAVTGDVVLTPGVLETGEYGYGYGTNANETQFLATFESTGTDLVLSVTGYDIDWPDEIGVYLNGELLGYLSVGVDNGLNDGNQFAIPASLQRPGNNEILFVENTPGWVWGVTELLLTEGVITGDVVLVPGVSETGEYGYGYGTNANETQFLATFESTGTDLVLSVTGYDIDWPDEISVYLNGVRLGYLGTGPNNGLNNGDQFAIPASLQRPGNNEILFVESTPGWVWGITDLYLYEGSIPAVTGDVTLTPGVPDTGEYGYGYGTNANETQFLATFEYTGTDLVLSVTGYDIDKSDEVAVLLNGIKIGNLKKGRNNGLNSGDVFAIPAAEQVLGNNRILFVEKIPGYIWGVTDLLLNNP